MTLPILELAFSSTEPCEVEKDGDSKIIWKDILREGEFAITPGRKKRVPFTVITDGASSSEDRIISMSDLEEAFDDGAFEHVTIPLAQPDNSHPDPGDVLNNSGYVKKLRRKIRNGVTYQQAGMGFTEPEVKGKVQRGSIPNCSAGVYFGHTRKSDGKQFRASLNHVMLTKAPWIDKLEPFKALLASDSDPDPVIEMYQFADSEIDTEKVEIVWNETDGTSWLRDKLSEALSPDPIPDDGRPVPAQPSYYVEDFSQEKGLGLVQEHFKGDTTRFLIPFTKTDNGVETAPATRWVEIRSAMIAASDNEDPFVVSARSLKMNSLSMNKIKDKVRIALSDMLGKEIAEKYELGDLSVDNRFEIKDPIKNLSFAASFQVLDGGEKVVISSPGCWESLQSVQSINLSDTSKKVSGNKIECVEKQEDMTPEARVAKARKARKSMLLTSTNHI